MNQGRWWRVHTPVGIILYLEQEEQLIQSRYGKLIAGWVVVRSVADDRGRLFRGGNVPGLFKDKPISVELTKEIFEKVWEGAS